MTIRVPKTRRKSVGRFCAECPDAAEIGDRVEAINYAVSRLGEGDMLVIAGKGHENGQKIGDRIIPMNDLEEAAKAIARLSR